MSVNVLKCYKTIMATVASISVSSNLAGDHAMTMCNLSFQYMCDWLLQGWSRAKAV